MRADKGGELVHHKVPQFEVNGSLWENAEEKHNGVRQRLQTYKK